MSLFRIPQSEIDRLIDAIEARPNRRDEGEVDRLFIEFQPMLKRLRHGEALEAQVKKLLYAGNPERAVKLLRASERRRRLPLSRGARTMLVMVAIPLFVLLAGSMLPRWDGAHPLAMQAVNQCPTATARLGGDIEQALVGWSCGQSETNGGGWGHANWTIPVKGARRSGRLQYAGEMHGGSWRLTHAVLEVGEEHLSIYPCSDESAGRDSETPAP